METQNKPNYWAVLPARVRYDERLRPNAKLIYAEIAALSGKEGYCYASNRYLAEIYGIGISTVKALVAQLIELGYIIEDIRRDGDNNAVTERRLYTAEALPIDALTSSQNRDEVVSKNDRPSSQNRDDNQYKDNNNNKAHASAPEWEPTRFAGFWKTYPLKRSKQAAIRAWDTLKPSSDIIDTMARALLAQIQSEQWQRGIGIPYASTWLNNARWEDEPEPNLGTEEDEGSCWV